MRRIAVVLVVAAVGAVFLWVLSEFEGSPNSSVTPTPMPARPTATITPIDDEPSVSLSDPVLAVSAQLPGEGWLRDTATPDGISIWRSPAQSLAFAVIATEQAPSASDDQLSDHATQFAQSWLTGDTVDKESFHGLDAYRIEGIGGPGLLSGHHCVGYVYTLQGQEYALCAGAKTTVWDVAHRHLIGAMLDGVQFR